MKELCIPIPQISDDQVAEVHLTVGGKKITYHFRVESFPWISDREIKADETKNMISFERIQRLKNAIENYDQDWELIQIYTPAEDSKSIQVLFRKRQ